MHLPRSMITIFAFFAPLFSQPVFKNGALLLTGHFLSHERRRKGTKIKGLGRHRDALASSKSQKVLSIGHNWLVATVRLHLFGSKYKWSLPFLSYLLTPEEPLSMSRNAKDLQGKARHKKMTKATCQIILQVRRWIGPGRRIIVIADNAFACRDIGKVCIAHNVIYCTQLRLDASLYDFPPVEEKKRRGRPRIVGKRLPNFNELLEDKSQKWERVIVPWYGGKTKALDVLTGTCLWYHNTVGGFRIRWVLTIDPEGDKNPVAILVTDLELSKEQSVGIFVGRWSIETTFQEIHEHLGLEGIHTWSDLSINRTAPAIIASYSLACLIAHQASKDNGVKVTPQTTAWYTKETVSFSDVMVYLRMLILNDRYFSQSGKKAKCGKIYIGEIYRELACA